MLFYPFINDDESDIIGNCESYEERYHQVLDIVEKKRSEYEYWRGDVEAARAELENDTSDEDALITPNSRLLDDAHLTFLVIFSHLKLVKLSLLKTLQSSMKDRKFFSMKLFPG